MRRTAVAAFVEICCVAGTGSIADLATEEPLVGHKIMVPSLFSEMNAFLCDIMLIRRIRMGNILDSEIVAAFCSGLASEAQRSSLFIGCKE